MKILWKRENAVFSLRVVKTPDYVGKGGVPGLCLYFVEAIVIFYCILILKVCVCCLGAVLLYHFIVHFIPLQRE